MQPTFEYCALKYLNIYQQLDIEFIEGLKPENKVNRLEILKKSANAFRIARNFKDFEIEQNKERILLLLDNTKALFTENESIQTVCEFSNRLKELFPGKNYFSASSKFLWLKYQSPIIIMDSRTIKALDRKLKPNNYDLYYIRWKEEYAKYESEIIKSCLELPSVNKYFYNSGMDITEIIRTKWFPERVFDIYLWEKGGE